MEVGINNFWALKVGRSEREIKAAELGGLRSGRDTLRNARARIQGWFSGPTAASQDRFEARRSVKAAFRDALFRAEGEADGARILAQSGLQDSFFTNDHPLTDRVVRQVFIVAQAYREQCAKEGHGQAERALGENSGKARSERCAEAGGQSAYRPERAVSFAAAARWNNTVIGADALSEPDRSVILEGRFPQTAAVCRMSDLPIFTETRPLQSGSFGHGVDSAWASLGLSEELAAVSRAQSAWDLLGDATSQNRDKASLMDRFVQVRIGVEQDIDALTATLKASREDGAQFVRGSVVADLKMLDVTLRARIQYLGEIVGVVPLTHDAVMRADRVWLEASASILGQLLCSADNGIVQLSSSQHERLVVNAKAWQVKCLKQCAGYEALKSFGLLGAQAFAGELEAVKRAALSGLRDLVGRCNIPQATLEPFLSEACLAWAEVDALSRIERRIAAVEVEWNGPDNWMRALGHTYFDVQDQAGDHVVLKS